MNETKTPDPTPEQLITLLESRMQLARAKRTADNSPRRVTMLVGGVLLIVAACCVALLILQQMLSDLRQHPPESGAENAASVEQGENFGKDGNAGISTATSL